MPLVGADVIETQILPHRSSWSWCYLAVGGRGAGCRPWIAASRGSVLLSAELSELATWLIMTNPLPSGTFSADDNLGRLSSRRHSREAC